MFIIALLLFIALFVAWCVLPGGVSTGVEGEDMAPIGVPAAAPTRH